MKATKQIFFSFLLFAALTANAQVGIGVATPDASSQLDVSSVTKGFLPPRMTSAQRDLIAATEGLMIYNTSTKRPNYYDGWTWNNFDGSFAGTIAVGQHYQGGIIGYIFQAGDPGYIGGETHGLIVAPDNFTGSEWGCINTSLGVSTAIGTGQANTAAIIAGCAQLGIGARLCDDLTVNGYSDWYLPSKDELNKFYINRATIGGFLAYGYYWSSSQCSGRDGWGCGFQLSDPGFGCGTKDDADHIRAARSF